MEIAISTVGSSQGPKQKIHHGGENDKSEKHFL